MKYLVLMSLVAMVACSSGEKLTDKAKEIEVYDTKPTQCRVVGKVEGENAQGSKDLALNNALNKAAKLDANGLFVNQEVPNGNKMTVYATAYQCD